MHLCNQIFLVLTGGTCFKSSAGEKDKDWEVKPELKHTTSTSWIAGKAPITDIKKGTNTLFAKWKSSICIEVKVAQSCPTLCDLMDYTVHEILQARILEWVAFPFSRGSLNPGIEPRSPTLQEESLPAEPQGSPSSVLLVHKIYAPCFMEEAKLGASNCTYPLWLPA